MMSERNVCEVWLRDELKKCSVSVLSCSLCDGHWEVKGNQWEEIDMYCVRRTHVTGGSLPLSNACHQG